VEWLIQTIKKLRGPLGLTRYYRILVENYGHMAAPNYGHMAAPLRTLLKKDPFQWNKLADAAFERLKEVMCST